jgi:hypothetical protein
MVVSPVSLTTEEVQLPPGARQKQPTLLGLGAALGVLVSSEYEDVDPEPDDTEGTGGGPSGPAGASGPPSSEAAPPEPAEVEASAQRLADFALKLSIGPVSRLWLPEVRTAVAVLLAVGKQRKEPTLALVSGRLLELILRASASAVSERAKPVESEPAKPIESGGPEGAASEASPAGGREPNELVVSSSAAVVTAREAPKGDGLAEEGLAGAPETSEAGPVDVAASKVAESSTAPALEVAPENGAIVESAVSHVVSGSLGGAVREQMLHEVTRLAGLVPEWPAAAQDLADETRRRETRLLRDLLESVDGLRRDHRARVAEQMRLMDLAALAPEALAEEFETPLLRAAQLSEVLGGYRQLRQSSAPDVGNVRGVQRALGELERAQERFEESDPERKDMQRLARTERRRAMTALWLELAERGELEQLELLEPLCVAERIERLHQWLATTPERSSPV